MFFFIYTWINDWVNNREAGDLRRQNGHYDVIVMQLIISTIECCAVSLPALATTYMAGFFYADTVQQVDFDE